MRILIIGANGQIGTELTQAIVDRYGADAVVTSDIAPNAQGAGRAHEILDVTDSSALAFAVSKHRITQI